MNAFRVFFFALLLVTVAGCKIQVEPSTRGDVRSVSGAYDCNSGQVCDIEVDDVFFDETYVAEPVGDHVFARWRYRERGLCGGSSLPCRLFTTAFAGNTALEQVLASDQVFYLEPSFEPAEQPWSTSGTYRMATEAFELTCTDGTTVALPARSQRVLVTEVAYNMRVKFLAEQTIGGVPVAELFDAFGTVDNQGKFALTRIAEAGDDGDNEIEETLTLSGKIVDEAWRGQYRLLVSFSQENLRICSGVSAFSGERISPNISPIDASKLTSLNGNYRIHLSAQELSCNGFPDTESLPLSGKTLSVDFRTAADLVSNTLLDELDTGSALQIVSPTPLAGWVEEDFFASVAAVRASSENFPEGFTLLGLFYGDVQGDNISGVVEFERQIQAGSRARACFDEFTFTGARQP